MVDVAAVPDRLEDAVGETENQDVLNRFLAEIMVDAINLALLKDFSKILIEGASAFKVPAKRLLDYQPPPGTIDLFHQPCFPALLDNSREKIRRCGEVEEHIAASPAFLVQLGQQNLKLGVSLGIFNVSLNVVEPAQQVFPHRLVYRACNELAGFAIQRVLETAVIHWVPGDTHDRDFLGQEPLGY